MQLNSGCLQPQIFVKSNYFKTKGRSIMRLGQKIAALHKKNHLFQEALAKKMNVSRQAVSLWTVTTFYYKQMITLLIKNLVARL